MNADKWAVMVYLVGDNNLSEDVAGSLQDIRTVAKYFPSNVRAFAFFDGGNPMIRPQFFGGRGGELEEVDDDMQPIDPLNPPDNAVNSADKETLVRFVQRCKSIFPADHYALVISGHGDGFLGRTLLRDENPGSNMTLEDLHDALRDVRRVLGRPLSILGFDSCLMNMLEVAYEIRNCAEILVASSGNVPNAGWNYLAMLSVFATHTAKLDPELCARAFVDAYVDYEAGFAVGGRSTDLTATYLHSASGRGVERVAKAVDELGQTLIKELGLDRPANKLPPAEERFRDTILEYILQSHYECQTSMYGQAVDIQDFCNLLKRKCESLKLLAEMFEIVVPAGETGYDTGNGADPEKGLQIAVKTSIAKNNKNIVRTCQTVISAVKEATILAGFCGAETQFTKGMTVFFPWTYVAFSLSAPKYEELRMTEDHGSWMEFLSSYLQATYRLPEGKSDLGSGKSNPRYGEKGMDSDTYLNYFSRIKNYNWQYDRRYPLSRSVIADEVDASVEV